MNFLISNVNSHFHATFGNIIRGFAKLTVYGSFRLMPPFEEVQNTSANTWPKNCKSLHLSMNIILAVQSWCQFRYFGMLDKSWDSLCTEYTNNSSNLRLLKTSLQSASFLQEWEDMGLEFQLVALFVAFAMTHDYRKISFVRVFYQF